MSDPQHRAPRTGRHRGGRPSRLTPAVEEKLLGFLKLGNYRGTAARAAGVSASTFYRAMGDKRPRFREFREAVERAEAQAEVAIIGNIVAASRTHPDVALRFAGIRWPDRWGPHAVWGSDELDPVASVPSMATATITLSAEFMRGFMEVEPTTMGEPASSPIGAGPIQGVLDATPRPIRRMDLLDRYLDFEVWVTHRVLDDCAGLGADQLGRRFDIGHGTLGATVTHIVALMELWTDLLCDRAVRPPPQDELSFAHLRRRFDAAAAEFGARAREIRDRDGLDEVMRDTVVDPPAEMTRGTVIADLIAHGITHRAEALHILARLGIKSTGDLTAWEQAMEQAAPRLGLRGMP